MAYGVKYRLNFRDDRGFLRRVDILKNNYVGSILDWVGDGDPIVIKWASDKDIYSPIIGSVATLNMQVTDSISYDNFFEYDEREYQVKVYFDNKSGGWNLYWIGYITNDIYQEAIRSKPYVLSITANDAIGTLDGFKTWTPPSGDNYCTLWEVIYNNLNYLGYNLDIHISNDIRDWNDSVWSNVFNSVTIDKVSLFKDYYTIRDAKETLASIMLMFNCRIFQSQGKWFIINNSSYGDQRVLSYIQANQSATESTILGVKQGYLNSGSETIKYYKYSYDGTLIGNETIEKLLETDVEIRQVNNNLVKLLERPIKEVVQSNDISQKYFDVNDNASFEFGSEYWAADTGTFGIVQKPLSGDWSLFTNEYVNTETQVLKLHSTDLNAYCTGSSVYEFQMSINLDTEATTNKIWYAIGVTDVSDGNTYYYFGNPNANMNWGSNFQWNEINITTINDYFTFKKTLEKLQTTKVSGGVTYQYPINGNAVIYISKPYSNTNTTFGGAWLDNIALRYTIDQLNKFKTLESRKTNSTSNKSGVIKYDGIYFANVASNVFAGNFGNTFKRVQDATGKKLEEISVSQKFNDYYNYLKTYNCDFTSITGSGIIDMTNKIYLNLDTYQETDSAIIDFISVSLKKNQYNIQFHIPNNYKDKSGVYLQNYIE